ncbi:uncharacterized protein PADG_11419 [Paracoccidioides brasiliensis Pb18]|uniref:RING-type domain-containing protein n=1 Tax=Paracoccidioides brasiliensis (strain Pb18) TaxID=502780 RepID=A0A0A0HY18_PARBD|nr:uncharacterized protein PADG_11419 [Paracoccidioides brasiliensis Pb18]KGM92235.1 hypothetical protein PADG_11419 [Paracoccidioides brasiliensis Pb18]
MDVVFESPVNVERPVAPALPHSSSSPEHPRSRSPFSSQSVMPPSSAFQFNPFSTHTPTAPDRLSQVPDVEGPLQDLVNSSASPRPHPAATAAAVTSFTSSPNPLPPQLDPQPSLEEDAMDTAPDNTQLQPEEVSSNSTPSGRSAGIDPARPAASVMEMDMEMETEQNTNSTINTLPTEGGPPETPTTTETGPLNFPERTTIGVPAMENNSPEPPSQGAPPSEGPLSQELSSPESPDPQAEQNSSPDGSQGNSQQPSVEEEEPADWADIEEDTSAPDEAELKEIESGDADYSALDYDYWEKTFYRELDDPEYKPAEKARLTWIFKGVRGTKENPNRATIMRSPAAYIGGVYWTIKFFPRGNNTGSLSIYLETSSTPPQPDRVVPETEFKVFRGPPNAVLSDLVPEVDITIPATANSSKLSSTQSFTSQGNEKQDPAIEGDSEPAPTEEREGEQKIESPSSSVAPRDWRVSAQIGVILYNPNEPRTAWMQSSCHQFNSHNVDWGWTTFHGPWDRIHQRQRGQRQALLRDDTLAFDAYIRVFDDPTQSLWWHSSDSEPVWDSLSLTGYRPMGDSVVKYSFEVAGLVSWLLLAPFREAIQSVDVLEHFTTPGVKPRPLCESLQKLLWALRSDYHPHLHVDTDFVTRTLRNLEEFSRDVMEFWERLRRSLELELVGTDALEKLSKIFDGQNVSRTITDTTSAEETAPSVNCFHGDFNNSRIRIPAQSSDNIESGLKRYFSGKPGKWSLPAVLHVELARQIFDRASHHWNLISRRVGLDEELDLSGIVAKSRVGRYSLYGFVVHKGKRSSGQFYSILRPGGPGTRWLAFEDASDNKIECLTRKAAIDAHEGVLSEDARSHYDRSGRDVAVVVMYVRNDVLPQFLTGKIEPWKMAEPLRHYFHHGELPFISSSPISIEIYSLEDVSVVNNSLFDAHDLMATARSAGGFRHLTLPANTTFEAVRKKLALWYWKDEQEKKPEHIRMWQIDRPKSGFIPSLLLRNLPALNFPLSYFNLNVLRLWVHILSEGVFFARKKDAIKSSVSAALGWPDNKQFHLWHRVDGASILSISGSHKFFNIISMDLDGQCFIVGEVLPKSRCTTISERGSFATPDLLSKYLWAFSRRHPTQALTGTKTVEATFNGEYYSGEFKKGYYHGKGTHISDTGATYTGDFVLGQRHGKGIMEFTSGDTYDGDWREDERHGQGTFIERKTGNKYVGGYRAGKRHGKGISYWEVADEEMDLCQICYSEDQDALFYSCGHVCACVSCAKQVDICPMCRKKVTSVVKIYRS